MKNNENNNLIIIDTYFLVDKILNEEKFSDSYFEGLYKVIEERNKYFCFAPIFNKNLTFVNFFKVFNKLKLQKVPIITEYDLINIKDYFLLCKFIFRYPIHIIKLCYSINKNSYLLNMIKNEILLNIDQVTFRNYSRYLQGKKIAKIKSKSSIVISWFENQAIGKNFYKGIKTSNKKIKIIGAKLYVYAGVSELNTIIDENEVKFNIIPDKILFNGKIDFSNGKIDLPNENTLNFTTGPSLRYKKLFTQNIDIENRKSILILLTIYDHEIKKSLDILKKININNLNIMLKFHPSTNIRDYKKLIPNDIKIVNNDLYELFDVTKIVISSSTGAAVESVCMGIPVIFMEDDDNVNKINFFANKDKGIIWDETSPKNINKSLDKLLNVENAELLKYAKNYRDQYFTEPSKEKIISSFEL